MCFHFQSSERLLNRTCLLSCETSACFLTSFIYCRAFVLNIKPIITLKPCSRNTCLNYSENNVFNNTIFPRTNLIILPRVKKKNDASIFGRFQFTFCTDSGTSRSMSLQSTTPSFKHDFKKSSGSAMIFFGEFKTPKDMSQVTVCSSGFIAAAGRAGDTPLSKIS